MKNLPQNRPQKAHIFNFFLQKVFLYPLGPENTYMSLYEAVLYLAVREEVFKWIERELDNIRYIVKI
jgi:hypothetical protein